MSREELAQRFVGLGLAGLSYVVPPMADRLATRIWFTPFPFARSRSTRLPPGAVPVFFGSGDQIVEGYEVGEGPRTALLVHGWAGSSRQYRRIASRLAEEGYKSVVLDLPAHASQAGRQTNLYEIAAAIESAGKDLGPLDMVVAHSLGALATAVALQGSLRTDRLVLVAPGVRPRRALDSFERTLMLRPRLTKAIEGAMSERFGSDVWDAIPDAMMNMTIPERTLVIHDADDDVLPLDDSQILATKWGTDLVLTHLGGHNGELRSEETIERVAELARAVVTYG